jgi:hypothetical protein
VFAQAVLRLADGPRCATSRRDARNLVPATAGARSDEAAGLAEEVVEETAGAAEQRLKGPGRARLRRQPPIVHLAQVEDRGFAVARHPHADRRRTRVAQIAELCHDVDPLSQGA